MMRSDSLSAVIILSFTLPIYSLEPFMAQYTKIATSMETTHPSIVYYQNKKGGIVGVTNRIIIKLTNAVQLNIILEKYHLILIKPLNPTLYLLQTYDKSSTFPITAKLNNEEAVEYAHPDFLKKRVLR